MAAVQTRNAVTTNLLLKDTHFKGNRRIWLKVVINICSSAEALRGQRSASPLGSTWLQKSPSEYPPPKWGPWGCCHVSQYSNMSDSGGLSQKALCSRQRVARHARCRRGSAAAADAGSQSPAPWLPLHCAGEVWRRCLSEITVRTRSGIPAWARKLSHGRGFSERPWLGSVWSLSICGCDAVL